MYGIKFICTSYLESEYVKIMFAGENCQYFKGGVWFHDTFDVCRVTTHLELQRLKVLFFFFSKLFNTLEHGAKIGQRKVLHINWTDRSDFGLN